MQSGAKGVWITKNSGEKAEFSREKLRRSLEKSGAGSKDIQRIVSEIEKLLYPGMSTKEIYKKAFSLLRKTSRPYAAKYKLKKALMELGPSGYPFERYLAAVMDNEGYQVKVGQVLQGHCIRHEVDVIAEKGKEHFIVECKFHADSRNICDVKVPLYIRSRFLDLEKKWKQDPKNNTKEHQGWIATNTRFSTAAIQYGKCAGLHLLGWDYPPRGSLKERIDLSGVHPITCLTTLTSKEKSLLLKKMVVLCKDLYLNKTALQSIGVKGIRIKRVMAEARALCEM